ncbi:MAG: hypothetical protein ISS58_07480 [Dehalococcoidales bacterium]|nr:hypothetical protein [Dehalococcoidales bacterium]
MFEVGSLKVDMGNPGLMLGTVAGPPIAGWVFDNWGSYQGTWLAMAGSTFIGAIIMTMTPRVKE